MKQILLFLMLFVSIFSFGQTITINLSSTGGSANLLTTNYSGGAERLWTQNSVDFGGKAITAAASPSVGAIQAQANNGVIYNTTAIPGKITSITVTSWSGTTDQVSSLFVGTSRLVNNTTANYTATGTNLGTSTPGTWTGISSGTDYTFFAIKRGASTEYISTIVINYSVGKTVTFNKNATDATNTMANQIANVPTNLNANAFTRSGYAFNQWTTNADGSGISYLNSASFPFTTDTTLYAQWTPNNDTITFDGNGATSGTTATQTLATAATANLNSNGYLRTGYTFAGWATTSTGTVAYADGTSYLMGTSNVTLYAIWNTTAQFLTTSGTLSALTTVYGTASGNSNFTVSAGNLTNALIITPPSGFEISTSSGTGFTTSLNLGTSDRTNTIIYVRIAATTLVGTYSGNVSLTSIGVASVNVATPSSTVIQKPLTISGLSGVNKVYDGLTSAALTVTAALVGVVSPDVVTLSGTPISNFADKNVGTGKTITTTGYTLSGANAGNYSIIQPTATANISAKALTISAAVIASKVYNASAVSGTVTAGNLSGLMGSETLIVTATGLYADANAGLAKTATITYTLADGSNGGLATNYSLANGTGTGDITKANPVFTVATIPVTVGGTYALPGSNVTSTSDGVLSYSITAGGFATLSGTTITGVSIGTETLTVNQAASTNYNFGSVTVGVSVTTVAFANGDYRSINDGNWNGSASSGSTNTWQQLVSGVWTAISNSPPSNPAGLGTKTVYIRNSILIVGSNTAPNVVINSNGVLSTSTVAATFGNLLVKTGGIFNREANSCGVNGILEVEDNATMRFKQTNAASRSTSIWAGTEKFHANSNFEIITVNSSAMTVIEAIDDVSTYTDPITNTTACFGNVIVNCSTGKMNLVPSGFNLQLTAKDLIFRNNSDTTPLSAGNITTTIGGNLIIESTYLQSINFASAVSTINIIVKGNFLHNGTTAFRPTTNIASNSTFTIEGNLTVNNGGSFIMNAGSGIITGSSTANLKGNLEISSSSIINSTATGGTNFNFIATTGIQTIDVANQATASNINFNVNSGSYTKLINQDFALGTNSSFTAKTGATFDFGFNGTTALNLSSTGSGQTFTTQSGSTLKITSPFGITTATASLTSGNVQTPVAGRTFDAGAIYHYIGKANQVTGNGLQNGAANKYIIVELATDNLEFTSNNGIIRFNNPASAIGSNFRGFEIRKGTVVADDAGNRFEDSANTGEVGNLKMTGGIYKIFTKDIQPAVSGNYDLSTGSKIIFAHTTLATTTQAIRGGTDYQYPEIEVIGKDVRYSNVNLNMKSNGLLTVKENAILTNNGNSGQIISLNDATPATLTIKNTGTFKTEKENGFSGVTDGINHSPSVRANATSGNVVVVLEPGSTVEYSRAGDQIITNLAVAIPVNANYQNLTISGVSGIKTLQNQTSTKVNEDLNVVSSKLLLNVSEIITVKKGVKIASGGAEFEIKNKGQLIQLDEADTNTGTGFKYNRIAMADYDDYVYWSSPVDAYNFDNILGADRYFWNPLNANSNGTTGNWNPTTAATPMQKARGYIVKVPNSFSTTASPFLSLFEGKPNNGAITFDIARAAIVNSEDDRWNLTGNPYPSAIDAEQFLTANDTKINGAVWVWTHGQSPTNTVNPYYQNFVYNYYASDYVVYNKLGSSDPNTFSGKIAAGQGFMVNMLTSAATPNTILFTNAMRTDAGLASYNNSDFYKNSNPNSIAAVDEKHRIWIDILNTNDGQKNRILLGYATNATLGKDHFYDCFYSPNTTEVGIYTLINSDPFSIQGRPLPFTNTDLVPIGVKIVSAGNHKIALGKVDGLFAAGQDIYLEDNLLRIIHNLKNSPYSFTSPIGVFNDRFIIRYTNEGLSNADFDTSNDTVLVAVKNNQIIIKSVVEAISSVVAYDVLGREITKLNDINLKEVTLDNVSDKNQALILKITLENGLVATRKIIL